MDLCVYRKHAQLIINVQIIEIPSMRELSPGTIKKLKLNGLLKNLFYQIKTKKGLI